MFEAMSTFETELNLGTASREEDRLKRKAVEADEVENEEIEVE